MKPHIVAIVPMRENSQRVPRKNYRLFAGKPLYHRIIKTLNNCSQISQVVIDTNSQFILKDAAKHFSQVKLIQRPQKLISGKTSMNQVILNTIKQVKADYFLQTHCTNPLLTSKTISKAIKTFFNNFPKHDSLFSVTRLQTRLWNNHSKPLNHNPRILLRTQDLTPVYEENSNLYIFSRKILLKYQNRIGKKPYLFEINPKEAWDIDEELDFQIAEFLFKHK